MKSNSHFNYLAAIAATVMSTLGMTRACAGDSTPFIARHGLTSAQYQAAFNDFGAAGYRLVKVSGYEVNNSARFAAFWEKVSGPAWRAHHNQTGAQFQASFNANVADGYRMKYADSYEVGGKIYYASIWDKEGGPAWKAYFGMTSASYQNKFNTFGADGYRVKCVSGARVGGNDYYVALWVKEGGPLLRAHHGQSPASYQASFTQNLSDGYRPVHISAWASGNSSKFASIWEKKGGDPLWGRHHMTHGQYQSEFENAFYTGYRIRLVNGYSVNGSPRFVAIWDNCNISGADLALIDSNVKNYMNQQGMPGLSIAISRKGKLVYARGFGWADTGAKVLMSPRHQLRNASVSKAMTGLAVMRLVQQGQLSLSDKVFGSGAILGNTYGTLPYSDRVKDITVRQLLTHTSGWSNDNGSGTTQDPMFMNFNTQKQVIDFMIDSRGVANAPGSTYEYLNFGFCVMGRVIAKVSGQSYENYVKNAVLAPSGVTKAGIGNTTKNAKLQDEVTYYPSSAYDLRPRHMDAHGGWVTSPMDLVKMSVHADGYAYPADLINASSRTQLLNGTAANSGYGLGWFSDGSGQGHNGAMRGTIGFLWQQNAGDYSIAILANRRPASDKDDFCFQGRNMVLDIVNSVSKWPSYDLFSGSHAPVFQINPDIAKNLPTDLMIAPKSNPIQRIGTSDDIKLVRIPIAKPGSGNLVPSVKTARNGERTFELAIPTEKGKHYAVEATTNLDEWDNVDKFEGTGESVIIDYAMTRRTPNVFFRVIGEEGGEPERELELLPERVRIVPVDPGRPIRPVVDPPIILQRQ